MNYKTFLLIVFLFVSNLNQIFAEKDENVVTLIVHGVGISETDAVNDAHISAIRQATNSFVFNEQIITNGEFTKDNHISLSSGRAKDFKIISSNRKADGRFEIKASVSVEKNSSLKNLRGLK